MKPRVFIGSSSEKLDIANAIQTNLHYNADCTVWSQGVFKLSRPTIDSLTETLNNSDYGIFVFAPDDVTEMRKMRRSVVRDNVLFELGLFMGRFGPQRTAIVKPMGQELHIPTDLLGLTIAEFDVARTDENLTAALGPACTQIRDALRDEGLLGRNWQLLPPQAFTHLRELSEWILNLRDEKIIQNWEFELHIHKPNGSSSPLFKDGFSVFEVKKCRYVLSLPEQSFSLAVALGSIAASKVWQDNPAYIHCIYVRAMKEKEKEYCLRAFHERFRDPATTWNLFFENARMRISQVGSNKWYNLIPGKAECGEDYVVTNYFTPKAAKQLIGKEVLLDLEFRSVRPNSLCEFTISFPWLTLGCDAQVIVHGKTDYLVASPSFIGKTKPQPIVDPLNEKTKVQVNSKGLIVPGSFVHIRWCEKDEEGERKMNHIGTPKDGGKGGGKKGGGTKGGGKKGGGKKGGAKKGGAKKR